MTTSSPPPAAAAPPPAPPPSATTAAPAAQLDSEDSLLSAAAAGAVAAPSSTSERLLVVANRLPLTVIPSGTREEGGAGEYTFAMSSGGLVSGLKGIRGVDFLWIGWPGNEVPACDHELVAQECAKHRCVPVFLDGNTINLFYNGFCNNVLWPLIHYIPPPLEIGASETSETQWIAYQRANAKFVRTVLEVLQPGDIIWVHDYHLMLVPRMLRYHQPQARIGWFLHTPFPSHEIFRMLPCRRELLVGLLSANFIGFHVYDYLRHFVSACVELLGLESTPHGVDAQPIGGVFVYCGAVPIGIEPLQFTQRLQTPAVRATVRRLKSQFGGKRIILGVDRLDYMKGIPHKLNAFDLFLEMHPEWVGRTVIVQLAVPTRSVVPEYQRLKSAVHELVGQINGRRGNLTYVPVHYLDQSLSFNELVGLYRVADVAIITSLRDGMNLVAYEYIACQAGKHGALILSEFAGACQSLGAACLKVNPWNLRQTADAIHQALTMSKSQRRSRHDYAMKHVLTHTSQQWANIFIDSLREASEKNAEVQDSVPPPIPVDLFVESFVQSRRQFLMVDLLDALTHARANSGILVKKFKKLIHVPAQVVTALASLARQPSALIIVSTPHTACVLERIFQSTPVCLAAEKGCVYKGRNGQWVRFVEERVAAAPTASVSRVGAAAASATSSSQPPASSEEDPTAAATLLPNAVTISMDWMPAVEKIYKFFERRTPGSYTERTTGSVTWYWDDSLPDFGKQQSRDLLVHLWTGPLAANNEVEAVVGPRYIEVRHVQCGRQKLLQRILDYEFDGVPDPLDFVATIGNFPRKDEDFHCMFNPHYGNPSSVTSFGLVCTSKETLGWVPAENNDAVIVDNNQHPAGEETISAPNAAASGAEQTDKAKPQTSPPDVVGGAIAPVQEEDVPPLPEETPSALSCSAPNAKLLDQDFTPVDRSTTSAGSQSQGIAGNAAAAMVPQHQQQQQLRSSSSIEGPVPTSVLRPATVASKSDSSVETPPSLSGTLPRPPSHNANTSSNAAWGSPSTLCFSVSIGAVVSRCRFSMPSVSHVQNLLCHLNNFATWWDTVKATAEGGGGADGSDDHQILPPPLPSPNIMRQLNRGSSSANRLVDDACGMTTAVAIGATGQHSMPIERFVDDLVFDSVSTPVVRAVGDRRQRTILGLDTPGEILRRQEDLARTSQPAHLRLRLPELLYDTYHSGAVDQVVNMANRHGQIPPIPYAAAAAGVVLGDPSITQQQHDLFAPPNSAAVSPRLARLTAPFRRSTPTDSPLVPTLPAVANALTIRGVQTMDAGDARGAVTISDKRPTGAGAGAGSAAAGGAQHPAGNIFADHPRPSAASTSAGNLYMPAVFSFAGSIAGGYPATDANISVTNEALPVVPSGKAYWHASRPTSNGSLARVSPEGTRVPLLGNVQRSDVLDLFYGVPPNRRPTTVSSSENITQSGQMSIVEHDDRLLTTEAVGVAQQLQTPAHSRWNTLTQQSDVSTRSLLGRKRSAEAASRRRNAAHGWHNDTKSADTQPVAANQSISSQTSLSESRTGSAAAAAAAGATSAATQEVPAYIPPFRRVPNEIIPPMAQQLPMLPRFSSATFSASFNPSLTSLPSFEQAAAAARPPPSSAHPPPPPASYFSSHQKNDE